MVSRLGVASSNTAALNSKIDPAIEGNILDHLQEGIVILAKDNYEVLFVNKALNPMEEVKND